MVRLLSYKAILSSITLGNRYPLSFFLLVLISVYTVRSVNELIIRGASKSVETASHTPKNVEAVSNHFQRPHQRLGLRNDTEDCRSETGRHLVVMSWNVHKWIRLQGLITVEDDHSFDVCSYTSKRKNTCLFVSGAEHYKNADAVLFHGDFTSPRDLPTRLSRRQKWIFFSRETPRHTAFDGGRFLRLIRQVSLYNLTSTYSLKSDIPQPYSDEVCSTSENDASVSRTKDSASTAKFVDSDELKELRSIVAKKSHMVAWFVSHCKTSSRREDYVNELRRIIPVDTFGKCGTYRCPFDVHADQPFAECDGRLLNTTYKFYLSFENSLCDDYITEKFFRLRHLDIVPVVLGAANYTQWMPSGTFVDVRDFRSPRQLAEFLQRLDGDDEAYMEFLRRKRRMACRSLYNYGSDYSERLCRYLHQNYDVDQSTNIRHVIDPRVACVKPEDFYRNLSTNIRL